MMSCQTRAAFSAAPLSDRLLVRCGSAHRSSGQFRVSLLRLPHTGDTVKAGSTLRMQETCKVKVNTIEGGCWARHADTLSRQRQPRISILAMLECLTI